MLRKQSMRQTSTLKPEQRQEQKMISLTAKINTLMRVVDEQTKIIHEMRNDIKEKFGMEKVALNSEIMISESSSKFSAESSMPSQSYLARIGMQKESGTGKGMRRSSIFSNVRFNITKCLEIIKF